MINPRIIRLIAFSFLTICLIGNGYAQQNKIDSLISLLKNTADDSNKVQLLDDITWEYIYSNPEQAIVYANKELAFAEKIEWKKGIAMAENSIGIYYNSQGNNANTLVHFFKALKLREEINDKQGIAALYCNIGNIYSGLNNTAKALDYFTRGLKLSKEVGNKVLQATTLGNIGIIYAHQNSNDKALDNFLEAVKIDEEIGNKIGVATCVGNAGLMYALKGDDTRALACYLKAMQIDIENGNKNDRSRQLNNIGSLYIKQKKYKEAQEYLDNSLLTAKEIGNKPTMKDNYLHFAKLDSLQGNYKKAFEDYKMYFIYRDSISNEEAREKNMQVTMQYEFDKKQDAIQAEQDKKDAIAEQNKRKQQILIASISVGLFLLLLIAVIIFRSLRVTQKQKNIISQKSNQLSEALKSVNDSINYAQRIQKAKLPKQEDINEAFSDSFVLFKPKDIVSGDFYYFYKKPTTVYIAAVDCTGHGVPGAFMSLIGYEKLEEAVTQNENTSDILKQLNKRIKTSLKQTDNDTSTRDGMDIALCEVNTKNCLVKFAGANRPLWIIRKDSTTLEEIKATKMAIGGLTDDNQHFETHHVQLNKGDTFYVFSDGYADTFSGSTNKKLTTKKFKELLLSYKHMDMQQQKAHLDNFIEQWCAGVDQVDDILVIGVRL